MSVLDTWLAIAGITLTTVITRAGVLFLRPSLQLGPTLTAALRYAPACALTAVIVPDLLFVNGTLTAGLGNPRLLAGLAAVALFAISRGTLVTIGGGLLAFWGFRWLLG
ncbi:MAG: AzlD domain-containing protein [Steroidobacteraceae bacterium]